MENLPTKLKFPIIEEGQEVVRPDVINAVTQLAQLAQLVRIRKLEESKIPTGLKPLSLTITDTTTEIKLDQPWISFTLINDSTSYGVYLAVNSEHELLKETPIKAGGTIEIKMDYPLIHTLYLKAESGGSAEVRIFAIEGNKRWYKSR